MRSSKKVALVAYPAVLGAFSLILVYIGSIAPSGNWGIVAVAGLFPAAAVISVSLKAGVICWAGVSLLSFILVPGKFCALMYAILFGLYPIVKALIERIGRRSLQCFLKLLFFNVSFSVLFLTMKAAVLDSVPALLSATWLLYLAGNIVFLIYDFGFSKLIAIYITRVSRVIR